MSSDKQFTIESFKVFKFTTLEWIFIFSLLMILSMLNWLLESFKWKLLVNSFCQLSLFKSVKQSLMAHSVAMMTPFKTGEFGLKPLFYKKENAAKVMYLSFLTNASQLFSTIIFGIFGLMYFSKQYIFEASDLITRHLHFTGFLVIILLVLCYVLWRLIFKFKLRYLVKRKTHVENIGLAMLRYLVFSHQWVLLLLVLKPESDYLQLISAVFSMYLIASILPVFAAFDWAVKGSVAVLLFSLMGFEASLIIAITLLLWVGNFLFPALLGLYFMFRLKPFYSKAYA